MKTYSYQAILSSNDDTSYDIELPSLSVRFTNDGAPQRAAEAVEYEERIYMGTSIKKVSAKES